MRDHEYHTRQAASETGNSSRFVPFEIFVPLNYFFSEIR